MKDIEIKISQETRMVDLKKTVIGNDAENLQGNLVFSFADNFVNGAARLEYEIGGNKKYIMLEKKEETYITPIKSVLTKKGQINMQLVITEGTSKNDIPIFKSNIFYVFCNQSINAEIEQPDEYPSWIEIANAKINEVDEAILGIEEAKRYAVEQGNYAKEQGDYAKSQGDYAKTQKIEVVKANEEANKIISDFEKNVSEYTTSFNDNAINKTNDFDSNAESKTSDFNQNVDNKLTEYNKNASEKLSVYNTNASEKLSVYNTNVANQTKIFNDNANGKLDLYNQNDTTKTTAFNDNATNKTTAFNSNANSKTETYNNNHTEKLNAYNTNATSKVNDYNTNASTKLQEYNTNADNKIAEYDLHSQELDNKIIATRNELERVKNDVLETGTDTDTFIHLEDSAMAEYQELEVDGVCEQETTIGKQLFDYTKINSVSGGTNNNGVITTTNKSNEGANVTIYFSNDGINIQNGDTIYFSADIKLNSGSSGTWNNINDGVNGETTKILQPTLSTTYQRFQTSLKYSNDTIINKIYLQFFRVTGTIEISNIMISKNSNADFEPYTGGQPSPSPEYKQPISVIENSLKITSCNKNLLPKSKNTFPKTFDELTIDMNNDGSYTITGTKTTDGYSTCYLQLPQNIIIPAGTYTVSDVRLQAYGTESGKYQNLGGTFTITEPYKFGSFYWATSTVKTYNEKIYPQLEIDTSATPFEQHLETQITANLPDGEFIGKIDDTYKDTLKVEYNEEDGQYHLILNKMIGKVVLDGSENWFLSGSGTYQVFGLNYTGVKKNSALCSDYFLDKTLVNNIKNYIGIANNDAENRLYISNDSTTLDEFKTWLSENPVTVYYELAEPYTVDLGIVDQLITYNETTNLFTDSDLMPQINAKYYRNFISTVRNLQVNEKALKQELIDINTRLSALETAQTSTTSESEVVE